MAKLCNMMDDQPIVDLWPFDLSVGDGGFYGSVKRYFGENHLRRSVLNSDSEENKFRFFLRGKTIKCAVEIGTYKGTTTALIARYADKVITIDKKNYIDKYAFWLEYKVGDKRVYEKIEAYTTESNEDKADLLSRIDFDFAFIDGDHSEKGVRFDFDLVKKCGRVLFHDYYEENTCFDNGAAIKMGIVSVVDELPGNELTINRPFAYWEKK